MAIFCKTEPNRRVVESEPAASYQTPEAENRSPEEEDILQGL
jgi:hypothetical protein